MRALHGVANLLANLTSLAPVQDSIPWPRGDRLTVAVSAESASVRGDTSRVWYALRNEQTSEQAAHHFALRIDLDQYRMGGPARWYESPGLVQDSAAALWSALSSQADVQPGNELVGVWVEGVGLPGITAFRIQGYYATPPYDDSVGWRYQKAPSFWANSVAGFTVGIEPLPGVRDVRSLLQRVRGLTERACRELGWIANPITCARLLEVFARGPREDARASVHSFISQLDAGRKAGTVNSSAYWLLKTNIEYIRP